MIRFIRRRRRSIVWVSLLSIATAGVFVLAYRSPGYAVTNVSLNDGGIWVTRNDAGADVPVARFDKPVDQLGEGMTPPGNAQQRYKLDVYQAGANVLLYDLGKGELYGVNPASVLPLQSDAVPIPNGDQVALGGNIAAVIDPRTGNLWTASVSTLDSANPKQARPLVRVGADAAVTVGEDGTVYAVSAQKHRLYTLRLGQAKGRWTTLPSEFSSRKPEITVVGTVAVVLDPATGKLVIFSRGLVPLPASSSGAGEPVLQQPGAAASGVLVADNNALYNVPLNGGPTTTLSHKGSGTPANPVRLAGCDYAAWAGSAAAVTRVCDGMSAYSAPLRGSNIQRLEFRVNNGLIVLNDPDNGYIWGVDSTVQRLDDWNSIRPQQNHTSHLRVLKNQHQQRSTRNRPPIAKPDYFGVRLGQSTVLHPLDNDSDPDGDLLAITKVTGLDNPAAQVQIVDNGQAVKVTVNNDSGGDTHFRYTIDDGRGGQASALVTVHVYPPSVETAPRRLSSAPRSALTLAGGESVTLPVLADWRDREGDPMFVSAATASHGTVSTSGSTLTYTAPPEPGPETVTYAVTDGTLQTKQTIAVNVLGASAHAVPPTPQPDIVSADVNQPVTIHPLANDLPGADPSQPYAQLALTGQVVAPAGVTTTTNAANGTITASADQAGAYLLSYTESFGSAPPVVGHIRLDVSAPTAYQPPITMPDVAVLHGSDPTVIDPLANDIDPQNALLVVQSATVEGSVPIQVSVEQHRWLLIRDTQPTAPAGRGAAGAFQIHYTVSDGLTAPVQGDVAVTEVPALAAQSPPIATPDTATVRAGSSTEVSVLANDTDPQGEPLSLVPGKLTVHSASGKLLGQAWAVDGVVKYVAPPAAKVKNPLSVSMDYEVRDSSQNTAIGQVFLTVNPASARHNQPPNPLPLEARVDAGQQVTIHIPVYNVDPDGDVVTFTGITSPPKLGRIISYGPDSVVYQAYPQSHGPDQFTYQVADPYGKLGTATVRLTVAPAVPAQPPLAANAEAIGSPGKWIHVDVLANDLIGPGNPVTISLPPGQSHHDARVEGNRLVVRAPGASQPARNIGYVITNGNGESSSAVVNVRGVAGYDNPPVARDDYVPQPPRGTRFVTVNVRANDDDPDNPRSALHVIPLGGGAVLAGPGKLRIRLGSTPRLVPYKLSDGKKTSEAFVHVPAYQADRPTLKPGAPPIQIPIGGSRRVSLSTYVTDPRGPVRITTVNTLQATPTQVRIRNAGDKAIVISATHGYHGPGSVSFEVTDGKTLGAKGAHTAVLSLPVRVGPEAPELRCPATPLKVVAGAAPLRLDVSNVCLVWVDNPSKLSALTYHSRFVGTSNGLQLTRIGSSGRQISIHANPGAQAGKTVRIGITTSGYGQPANGVLTIRTIPAPPASVQAIARNAVVGKKLTIDVASALASPFGKAATPQILSVSAPSAVSVTSAGTRLTVLPRKPGTITFIYYVTDVAAQHARAVAGSVTLHVQRTAAPKTHQQKSTPSKKQKKPKPPPTPTPQPPTAPGTPYPQSVSSGQAVLAWTAPTDNGSSPIDQYQVDDRTGDTWSCLGSPCTLATQLKNGTTYQFEVRAHNAVGWGPWSGFSTSATPDQVPGTITDAKGTPADGSITVTWTAPPDAGSPISGYDIQISPGPPSGASEQFPTSPTATFSGLTNGTAYTFIVRAKNNAGPGAWSSATPSVTPFGTPFTMAAPTASPTQSANLHEKAITVTWLPADGNGLPITGYTVTPSSGSPVTVDGSSTSTTFTVPNNGASWTYTVSATNSAGLSSPQSPASSLVQATAIPDAISQVTASDNSGGIGYNGAVKLSFTIPTTNGLNVTTVNWQSSAGGSGTFSLGSASAGTSETETVSSLTNGATYTFTVQACNADGCGASSPASNQVSPYGPPGAPTASASASGTTINFSWSGGGLNGRPLNHYEISIDGGAATNVGTSTSYSHSYGYSQTHSIRVRFVDSAGQISAWSNTASATTSPKPSPPPTVTLSVGSKGTASNGTCQTLADNCYWMAVTLNNFPSGSHSVSCYDSGGSFWTYSQSVTTVSSGECIHGSGSNPVYVIVDGKYTSNKVSPWP